MFRVRHVKPEDASASTAASYGVFPPEAGVPEPMLMMSASPGLLSRQADLIGYYMRHPKLSFPLLTAIRYLMAGATGFDFCVAFNARLLASAGIAADQLPWLCDPRRSPLSAPEAAMAGFVLAALTGPQRITDADFHALREHGYDDADILDALAHGANMLASAAMHKVLRGRNEGEAAPR